MLSPMLKKRPCRICRKWFHPDPRVGDRQRTCSSKECQRKRQLENMVSWRRRHPEYPIKHRMRLRELKDKRGEAVDPLELPRPLTELPWEDVQKEFGVKGTDIIGHMGRLLIQEVKKESMRQPVGITRLSGGHATGFG